ncbi:macoilin [Toxorhynchites rutilus septentrionalis]|uniref:macoilin n=1 Tax=Toxorhynchites rutilus septentrionalis TaxID=329112 RepID=UPI00247B11CD|nr:macoilin [Toxorhynchites rutilus septentrionalis]XP_055625849.1 macoilin [Toxorhynchites rutilus septentrionalis]
MKRRNADCGKIRRPIKRNKIAEQIGSNTLLYVKFLLLWAFVITADFLLEFRFEFLWPFWLLLRSVYDSFKYKGLAFSVLFVCIAITSDLVCLFFIPVQWLFFAASTYVWVQYVWHTDKGICLPTIILWILFVYLEAAVRWKDSRNIPHLDLCRPFAAHCIGYPVVTLGFGFKSYVGYRIRQRKQREVAKDNDFYMQLLQEALPKDESAANHVGVSDSNTAPDQQDHQLSPAQQKELSVTATVQSNSGSNCSNNTSSSSSGAGGGGGTHSIHHHHNNNSNKNAQNHNKSQSNVTPSSHVNGHAVGGSNVTTPSNNGGNSGSSTMNGGVNHTKHLHRKSLDKEGSSSICGKANNYSYHQNNNSNSTKESSRSNDSSHTNGAVMSPKEKKDCDSTGQKTHFDSPVSAGSQTSSSNNKSTQVNENNNSHESGGGRNKNQQQNGHVVNYDMELQQQQQQQQQNNHIENDTPPEPKTSRSGRKNRVKQKENTNHLAAVRMAATLALASSITTLTTTAATSSTVTTTTSTLTSKDNHLPHSNEQQTPAGNGSVSNNTQSGGVNSSSSSSSNGNSTSTTTNSCVSTTTTATVASQSVPVSKVCESCSRLEADGKKLRSEISSLKQSENETRQRYESSNNNMKSCLQAKQKECDELQNRYQDLSSQRQQERQNLQTVERRLGEERRHRQSLESQLQNERKHRKQAEEKAARAECGEQCKLKRQQMDMEIQKLRRDLINSEDAKHNAEKQNRNIEQEMRKFEVQLRNRESQQGTEVLMSALAAMQDKNATLEKNLSAETRVKLDLFSALGDARRQLEITTGSLRSKEKEILDLKAKIVQLLAVMPAMPNESLCMTGPGPSPNGGGSMMRLTDAPQLLPQSALNGIAGQPSPMSHIVMNNPPLISQLANLGVLTSTITTSAAAAMSGPSINVVSGGGMMPSSVQQTVPGAVVATSAADVVGSNGQIVQMQNSNNCPSNLDPNASVYTPKNCSSMVGGTEA